MMWLTTPDVIAELDRAIREELRKQMIREGHIDPETGEWIGPLGDDDD